MGKNQPVFLNSIKPQSSGPHLKAKSYSMVAEVGRWGVHASLGCTRSFSKLGPYCLQQWRLSSQQWLLSSSAQHATRPCVRLKLCKGPLTLEERGARRISHISVGLRSCSHPCLRGSHNLSTGLQPSTQWKEEPECSGWRQAGTRLPHTSTASVYMVPWDRRFQGSCPILLGRHLASTRGEG